MATSIGTVCFFVKESRVLLVQIQYPDGRLLWNGIGGVVDADETPAQAVVREVGEETKLQVAEQDISEAMVVTVGNLELHIFVARSWSGELVAVDPTLTRFQWFDFDDVPYEQMHPGNDEWLPAILDATK